MPAAAPHDTTVEGVVRSVGSVPMVRTVVETEHGSYVITGPLTAEIGRLSGATVRVTGSLGRAAPLPPAMAIAAEHYELLRVQGETPHVGTLVRRNGEWFLAAADTVRLIGVPADFPAHAGDTIYVVGDLTHGALSVRFYGIIRREGE